jgi:hypothetical protein
MGQGIREWYHASFEAFVREHTFLNRSWEYSIRTLYFVNAGFSLHSSLPHIGQKEPVRPTIPKFQKMSSSLNLYQNVTNPTCPSVNVIGGIYESIPPLIRIPFRIRNVLIEILEFTIISTIFD